MTPKQAQAAVDSWNRTHPVGTPVQYRPGLPTDPPRTSTTRSPAWIVGGQPCVSVEGYAGGIALTHVEAVTS